MIIIMICTSEIFFYGRIIDTLLKSNIAELASSKNKFLVLLLILLL